MPAINQPSIATALDNVLVKRQFGYGYPGYRNYNSPWYTWGRWATLGAIIAVAIVIFALFSCFSARRRRKRGQTPYYGTRWMVHGQPQYYGDNNPNQYNQQPAPPYSAPNQEQPSYGNNQGYYGNNNQSYGQQNGIELQQPNNAYYPPNRGGENVYAAPEGPPPTKKY